MIYPSISPIAFHIGSLPVRWYGLAYLTGFFCVFCLGRYRLKVAQEPLMEEKIYEDLLFFLMLGVLLGGRIGYMLFYQFHTWISEPLAVFKIWQGGMSFHGGLIGTVLATCFFARKHRIAVLSILDFIAPMVPIGLFLGRGANFINGELWGRPTHTSWGMIYPWVDQQLRHPSQLYEMFLEGIVLYVVLDVLRRRNNQQGFIAGCFCLFYFVFRCVCELFRMPDHQLGFIFGGWLTMGQLLSLPVLCLGLYLIILSRKKGQLGGVR